MTSRPFPPGDYPVVVVGSGPGGLQAGYCLGRLGVEHAVLSADTEPGGMFRWAPVCQRLLSWTKPDAPFEPGTREYEWYDHNSLLGDEPAHQATIVPFLDRSFAVPSRAEMQQGLEAFAEKAGVAVRYGCRWESIRREEEGSLVLTTVDGEYRCRAAVFALGVTTPWKSPILGIEDVPHYSETREPPSYQGKRVFVVGKRNSGFEVADGLLPWARQVILGSPRPVQASVIALSSVRVRYLQPFEDAELGGGTWVLDAAIERIERAGEGFRILAEGTTRPGRIELEVDEVIAATGFSTPLGNLPEVGVKTVADGRIPALTPFWESEPGSGVYFAGNAMQGAAGLRKHGVGASSPAVHGFRYNTRVLASHLAATHLDLRPGLPHVERGELVPFLLREATLAPELWAQKSYLARVVYGDGATEVAPLANYLDHPHDNAVAVAVELNDEGTIYPTVYTTKGEIAEHMLPPHPLHDFTGEEYRRRLEEVL